MTKDYSLVRVLMHHSHFPRVSSCNMKYVRIIPYTIYLWSIGYEVLQLSAEGYLIIMKRVMTNIIMKPISIQNSLAQALVEEILYIPN